MNAKRLSRRRPKTKNTMLSLFSGCGGFDLGLEKSGFEVRLCVESDQTARETLRRNRPKWRLSSPGDIHKLNSSQLLEQAGLKQGSVDLIAAGPPCQPFSKSSYWVNGDSTRLKDPRASTIKAFLGVVSAALPRVVLLENVEGLNFRQKDDAVKLLHRRLSQINREYGTNYQTSILSMNSADYGVPQLRKRIFVLAQREGRSFTLPKATHGIIEHSDYENTDLNPYATAWDAIGDLDEDAWPSDLAVTGKWAHLLPSVPEGHNYLWHTPRSGGRDIFAWRSRYWSFLLKLAKNKPSWTIQAQPGPATGPFHWRNRRLSIRELCRLQTIPDDFDIAGNYREAQRQVGNAVPPLIGYTLGIEIRRQLLDQKTRKRNHFLIGVREGCPGPERRKPVRKKYLKLCGDHPDHPGTGKGPGARRQKENFL